MIKNIIYHAEIDELYFNEPRLGYYLPWDSENLDDVRLGVFIGWTVIGLHNGEQFTMDRLRAVRFSDRWFDLTNSNIYNELENYMGYPFWEEELEKSDE